METTEGIKTATLDVGGFKINATVAVDKCGDEFLILGGVDCDLQGEEPGVYYPVPR